MTDHGWSWVPSTVLTPTCPSFHPPASWAVHPSTLSCGLDLRGTGCRELGWEATEGRPGTKAQGLASASDPAWRGLQRGCIHLLILFHFQNTFLRQPGLFKEYD